MPDEVAIGGDGTLFIGEDKTFRLSVVDAAGVPVDINGWSILFDVRAKDTSPDPALLAKTATITGVYNIAPGVNTQRAEVAVSDDEMNTFKAKTYRYSWKRMTAGNETVLALGPFQPQKATAP